MGIGSSASGPTCGGAFTIFGLLMYTILFQTVHSVRLPRRVLPNLALLATRNSQRPTPNPQPPTLNAQRPTPSSPSRPPQQRPYLAQRPLSHRDRLRWYARKESRAPSTRVKEMRLPSGMTVPVIPVIPVMREILDYSTGGYSSAADMATETCGSIGAVCAPSIHRLLYAGKKIINCQHQDYSSNRCIL